MHGIGNKPEPSILKCQWDHALFGFDVGEHSRLAYWVNRDYYPRPEDATCSSGDLTAMEDEPTGEGLSVKQHLAEVPLEAEVAAVTRDPAAQRTLLAIARAVEANDAARATAYDAARDAGRPLRAQSAEARAVEAKILPLPAPIRRWIARKLTRALLRDVNDFLFVADRAERMRESVRERLRAGGGPFVVVGHSQGSMIAYAVLHEPEFRGLDVPLFVTIGSPLGMQEVQDVLKPSTGLRVPPNVRHWLNVADPLDPVAIDKRLGGDFRANDRGVRVEDELEWNPDSPRHPHSGSGYLKTSPVRTAVRGAVDTALFQPVADFVIARDVVRRMENHPAEVRHEVLIELADPVRAGAAWSVDDARAEVVRQMEGRAAARGVPATALRIEALDRYVAAELTREEAEWLSAQPGFAVRGVARIWRNSVKRALLDVSAHTIQAPTAHRGYQALGFGVEWAVLDTGINPAHPHFAQYRNVVAQYDCTQPGRLQDGGTAPDRHGHGTHVAGIIAGCGEFPRADAPTRILTGIAPAARLHVYKVLADDGTGRDAWIIKALDHVARVNERAGRVRIQGVNLSLGGPFDQSTFGCGHSPLCRELRRLWQQGVVVVLAAGNEGFATLQTLEGTVDANMDLSIGDPANLEEAIAVGSVHKERPHTYGISYFSSRGPTADGRQKPDLVAPGEKILSARHDAPPGATAAEELYVEMSGTSMACPHVSGLIAAFLSARGEFIGEPDRVKRILLDNCTDLARDRPMQGAGLPNLTKMLLVT
ncbi:MAG TPA: S8 family serine peptidase [Gemmatimonadaceae bacterium]|nr:S8 family serine peptidase [Gemmatimonadaceae bacterium]